MKAKAIITAVINPTVLNAQISAIRRQAGATRMHIRSAVYELHKCGIHHPEGQLAAVAGDTIAQ
jgi:predicted nucleic acid-binding protein